MKLTTDQQKTIDTFIDFLADRHSKYMIIQGSAGCGKSTLIKYLVNTAEKRQSMSALLLQQDTDDFNLMLAATTHPAVAVLEDLTGLDAATIHSHVGIKIVNNYSTGKKEIKLKKDTSKIYDTLIVIDEASMINQELLKIIDKQTVNCKILLIGDQYQLAPINQTETIMESPVFTRAEMNEIMRNSGTIMETGAKFRKAVETGKFPPIVPDNACLQKVDGPAFKEQIDKAFRVPDKFLKDIRVLAWTNAQVQEYNRYIRTLKGYPPYFQVGERVYTNKPLLESPLKKGVDSATHISGIGQQYTNLGVEGKNVELDGCYEAFLPNNPGAEKIVQRELAKKKDWQTYFEIKDKWLDLRSPYACTVHKAQGSTYDTVFIDLPDIGKCKEPSTVARMLYVAISRAKNKVVCYGDLPPQYSG